MSSVRPARGTRPANRRALILGAATELFAARGYENVNMADVAAEVAVGPSALYRHFRGKESLLEAVLEAAGDSLRSAARADGDDLAATVRALSSAALDNRSLGVLWQREARHLPTADHIDRIFDDVRDQLGRCITDARPTTTPQEGRYLAAAVLGILLSPSFHRAEIERADFEDLLTEVAMRVVESSPPDGTTAPLAAPEGPAPVGRTVRREVVLRAALDLFAQATYASVSMDDIAAAAGMATSSVYHHFPSKVDLLSIALNRGNGYLQLSLDRTLYAATDQRAALQELIASYCRFAFAHPAVVDLLITEARHLPSADGVALTQSQRDYVQEWVHLYRAVNPGVTATEATIVVQGVLMLMNDLARLPELRFRPGAEAYVRGLATSALLGAQSSSGGSAIGSPAGE